eukprot:m.80271 g.80271  ORF g.80271 m.80271 type:complete len:425 (+) comp14838_c0_seq1:238-1512(+)
MAEIPMPTAWNAKDKSPLLEVTQGVRVKYVGNGETDRDAASVRSIQPIHPLAAVYYFEVKIISKGREGYIGIGLCSSQASMGRLPGWEKNSYGYHGDDGHAFRCSGTGTAYGPTFTTGDTVGCCLNLLDRTCFYTKNGVKLDIAFRNIALREDSHALSLHPCVGLRTPGEEVEANFGQQPFVFDFQAYRAEVQQGVRASVERVTLPSQTWQVDLNQLVTAYLVHHGYSETAAAFARDSGNRLTESLDSIAVRKAIRDQVLKGQLDAALANVEQHYPGLLANNPVLRFRFHCQKFVGLVATQVAAGKSSEEASVLELLSLGQSLQQMLEDPQCDTTECRQLLKETFSVLAYPDPLNSPVAPLMDATRREPIAAALNSAILTHMSLPSQAPLERILQQCVVCLQEMRALEIPESSFLDMDLFTRLP